MSQPTEFQLLQSYAPIKVGSDLVWIVNTATVAKDLPLLPPGCVNVFYDTRNHIDYENPNSVVITSGFDISTGE